MAKARNHVIRCDSAEEVKKWVDEYAFIGREVEYDYNNLTVTLLALPAEYKKKREQQAKLAAKRESLETDYDWA